ncbi:V-type ATP synthase subunit A [Miniphocaeibacter halophilus]|uniref:V-type ATP synthase subunit A n=1 Tax=Miniphocaeibacter halophilus TaxID=2931922 RepID=A0AC61MPB2_9FIRM|nr:V-type ATP synthase subunit A [Miniphocaeibacter halophilus]QQK07362.1 V-type ATP synthase subunit A [Miniphocaeibacter halophilus]
MNSENGIIQSINGPVITGDKMESFQAKEMVLVGEKKLIGEVISLEDNKGIIQVYEETEGLRPFDEILHTNKPLSLKLGPGLIGNMFDGIERPLNLLKEKYGTFIPEGVGLLSIDEEKLWETRIKVKDGDYVSEGEIIAEVPETDIITHKIMVPVGLFGRLKNVKEDGKYNINETIAVLVTEKGEEIPLKMYQEWTIKKPRPIKNRLKVDKILTTGQRVLDIFFPIAKGGTVAIPGGFGTGKTMTQHQLAKYSDADIIVYIGCGERGNEMTEVLEDFPKLIDPNTNKSLMERTVLIANTSNMPVAAREASIYTGITIAEYFRDMGYDVAIMADSTSRWAEALREISGRLEEMPAEEGYPAYLPSRIAQFYERAGYVKTLGNKEGSVTIIGAVSPPGGDFSEPVTENTKRYVNVFLGLDKELAYSRHYPAINWLTSYSEYVEELRENYEETVGEDVVFLRNKILKLLFEEDKLQEIVMLVGEDVLPDDQRLIIFIAKMVKIGFLQQNAFHNIDTYVPIKKQYEMLKTIDNYYEEGLKAVNKNVPISKIISSDIYNEIVNMKYNISNDDLSQIETINKKIKMYFEDLISNY